MDAFCTACCSRSSKIAFRTWIASASWASPVPKVQYVIHNLVNALLAELGYDNHAYIQVDDSQ